MQPLVIEYILEGHRRGYNFTSPTHGYDDATLKTIWRQAMPRGQGWGTPQYMGARSLKCFPVAGRMALSEVVVTDMRDEGGRGGIRRAEIEVLHADACVERLKARLDALPSSVHAQVERRPTVGQWKRIVDEALPKLRREAQIGLAAPFTDASSWQAVEAIVLKVALSPVLSLKRAGKLVPFTTLALDYRDELPLVALPASACDDRAAVTPVMLSL